MLCGHDGCDVQCDLPLDNELGSDRVPDNALLPPLCWGGLTGLLLAQPSLAVLVSSPSITCQPRPYLKIVLPTALPTPFLSSGSRGSELSFNYHYT